MSRQFVRVLALIAAVGSASTGVAQEGLARASIIDGLPSSFAGVYSLEGASTLCSAFAITETAALTAAHCVDNVRASQLALCTRRPEPGDGTMGCIGVSDFDTAAYVSGPAPGGVAHDIAILQLRAPATPLTVRDRDLVNSDRGRRVDLYGYGRTSASSGSASPILRTANLLLSRVLDQGVVQVAGELTASGRDTLSPCNGDSGGAVVFEGEAVAVIAQTGSPSCTMGGFATPIRAHWDSLICPFLQSHRDVGGAALCGYPTPTPGGGGGGGGGGCSVPLSGSGLGAILAALGVVVRRRARSPRAA